MLIIVMDNKFGKESIMLTLPSAAEQLFLQFSSAFRPATIAEPINPAAAKL